MPTSTGLPPTPPLVNVVPLAVARLKVESLLERSVARVVLFPIIVNVPLILYVEPALRIQVVSPPPCVKLTASQPKVEDDANVVILAAVLLKASVPKAPICALRVNVIPEAVVTLKKEPLVALSMSIVLLAETINVDEPPNIEPPVDCKVLLPPTAPPPQVSVPESVRVPLNKSTFNCVAPAPDQVPLPSNTILTG